MDMERSPAEILRLLKRRAHLIAGLGLVAVFAGAVVGLVRPKTYRSETKIAVEAVGSLSGDDYLEKVRAVENEIKATGNFDSVVDQLHLDAQLQGLPEPERVAKRQDLIEELVKRTVVELEQPAGGVFHMRISHQAPDPDLAVRLVSLLSADYVQNSFERPIAKQVEAVQAFQEQVKEADLELVQTSDALQEFQEQNAEYLGGAKEQLQAVRDQIERLETIDIANLEATLRDLEADLEGEPAMKVVEEDVIDEKRVAEIEADIREVRRQIIKLQEENGYTDENPKIKALRKTIDTYDGDLARVRAEKTTVKRSVENPLYHAILKERREARTRLGVAERELQLARAREVELLAETKKAPEFERERDELARAKSAAQKRHDEAQVKLQDAKTHLENLRKERVLRFRTLDAPQAPRHPAGPGPLLIALAGLVVGLGSGAGIAYLLDLTDHSFRNVEDVSEYLSIPTLGAVHVILTPDELARRRSRKWRRLALLAVLGLAAAAALGVALAGGLDAVKAMVA